MSNAKNYLVAVKYDNDVAIDVIKVVNVNDNTYRSLLNKKHIAEQKELEEKNKLLARVDELEKKVELLELAIKELKGE